MTQLTRENFLNPSAAPVEPVQIPELGGTVNVRGLTAAERDEFEATMILEKGETKADKFRNLRARLVAKCIIDETGARMFTDDDVPALGANQARAIQRAFEVAQRLSGLSAVDVKELEGK
jgi:hypothetical protein